MATDSSWTPACPRSAGTPPCLSPLRTHCPHLLELPLIRTSKPHLNQLSFQSHPSPAQGQHSPLLNATNASAPSSFAIPGQFQHLSSIIFTVLPRKMVSLGKTSRLCGWRLKWVTWHGPRPPLRRQLYGWAGLWRQLCRAAVFRW